MIASLVDGLSVCAFMFVAGCAYRFFLVRRLVEYVRNHVTLVVVVMVVFVLVVSWVWLLVSIFSLVLSLCGVSCWFVFSWWLLCFECSVLCNKCCQ